MFSAAVLSLAICSMVASPAFAESDAGDAGQTQPGGTLTADEIARRVVERTGDPREIKKIAFSFVVEVGGDQKMRRRHVWWPGAGRLEVSRGESTIKLKELDSHNPTSWVDSPAQHADKWNKVAPSAEPARAAEAWGWFINDSYWLFAPAKLMDSGVNRQLDDQGRLVLTFGDVGLTPGDRYTLTIDRDRNLVTHWEYDLQSGRTGTFRWTDYQTFGPLYLSTRRVATSDDPPTVIRFEDIEVAQD